MAKSDKDIVIRVTGKDLTAPAFAGVGQHAKNLTRILDQEWAAQKRRANESLVAEQTVRRARIKAAEVEAREIRRIELAGASSRFRDIRVSERMAAYNKSAQAAAAQAAASSRFRDIRVSERLAAYNRNKAAQAAAAQAATPGFFGGIGGGAAKKAFGAAGLAAGMAGDSLGGSPAGRAFGAVGNIGGAAAMGGMVAGPWGAAIFGGIAALKEFKNAVDGAAESAKEQKEALLASRRQAITDMQTRMGEVTAIRQEAVADRAQTPASIRKRLADAVQGARDREASSQQFLNRPAGSRFTSKAEDRRELQERYAAHGLTVHERTAAEQELAKVDQSMFFGGARNVLGLSGRNALGGIGGAFGDLFGMARGAAQPGILAAQRGIGQFMADAQLNMGMRSQTRTGADQLRDQFAELEGMRGRLSPENYSARRRQLRLQAISGLPGQTDTPGLAATTGRFLTRGPEQKQADELAGLRREAKEHARANERALAALLSELQGEGVQE